MIEINQQKQTQNQIHIVKAIRDKSMSVKGIDNNYKTNPEEING